LDTRQERDRQTLGEQGRTKTKEEVKLFVIANKRGMQIINDDFFCLQNYFERIEQEHVFVNKKFLMPVLFNMIHPILAKVIPAFICYTKLYF
jgi:hypothetical protein